MPGIIARVDSQIPSSAWIAVLRSFQFFRKQLSFTKGREARIYLDAQLHCVEQNPQAFIDNGYSINDHVFTDWKRDKKGKLISCRCLLPGMTGYVDAMKAYQANAARKQSEDATEAKRRGIEVWQLYDKYTNAKSRNAQEGP